MHKEPFIYSESWLDNAIKIWLFCFLLFLPFQTIISKILYRYEISHFIGYLDEITVVIFLPLALLKLYKNRRIRERFCLVLLSSMMFFTVSGIASGFVNGNEIIVTAMGIFDYIKNIIVIIVYFAFFTDFDDVKKLFRFLLSIAVVLGIVSFLQEAWAMISVYIVGNDLGNRGNYIFKGNMDIALLASYWRFGMFRTSSLMVSTINSGLYGLLIFNIYLCTAKKVNFAVAASLFSSIFTSISRIVYMGFMFVAGAQIYKGRKWLIGSMIPIAILIFFMSNYPDLNVSELINNAEHVPVNGVETELVDKPLMEMEEDDITATVSPEQHYREYTREKALVIWKDYPLFGVGPGMFGGAISSKYDSHILIEYNFRQGFLNYFRLLKSVDNFWYQVLAELGIVGTVSFAGLLFTILVVLFILRSHAELEELKKLFTSLSIYMVVILIYTMGLSFNVTPVAFTYFAFVGIGLGSLERT